MYDGFSEQLNSEFLALINTKSDVIVSSELSPKLEPDCIVPNNLNGFAPFVLLVVTVPKFNPSAEFKSNASPFNNTVPMSGKNKPYDPLSVVYPDPPEHELY